MIIDTNLYSFAMVLPQWYDMLDYLATIALPEKWDYNISRPDKKNQKTPILENYICHTFSRLAFERNQLEEDKKNSKLFIDDNIVCFNTGLFNRNYKAIYAYFEKNKNTSSKVNWALRGFHTDTSKELINIDYTPARANYFENITDLVYNTKLDLRINTEHILDNPANRERIPESIRSLNTLPVLFDGAIHLAKKKIEANYKVAVPQYFQEQIQFLIPICLIDMEIVDLALAVSKKDTYYTGNTCLTMDMAYNNARLIAKPSTEWLIP